MTVSIGIDPGLTNAGLVVLGHGLEVLVCAVRVAKRQKGREQDLQLRIAELLTWAQRLLTPHVYYADTVATVECPIIGGRRDEADRPSSARAAAETFAAFAALFGMLRGQVAELYAPVPPSWRAAVRPEPMSLDELHRHLDRKWRVTERIWRASELPHALDAAGLAEYGLQQHAMARRTDDDTAPPTKEISDDEEGREGTEEQEGQDDEGRAEPGRRAG